MAQARVRPHRTRDDWDLPRLPVVRMSDVPEWDTAVRAFLRDARARNCSAASLANYTSYLLGPRAQQFVAENDIKHVSEVTSEMLRNFQADLLDAGLSPGTAATFHRIMRNFLGFCDREGWDVPPGVLKTAPPRQPLIEPETFSPDEEARLLQATRTPRDRFLVEFMLRTGLRLAEVTNVTLNDIVDGPNGTYLRVRQGKGGKDRVVPLDTEGMKFSKKLRAYINKVRPSASKSPHLFLSVRKRGTQTDYSKITSHGIASMLQRLEADTGIHANAHKFRHTFATRALQAGVDSLVLQRALGHTTLTMVNRYVHFNASDLLNAWKARSD